MFANWNAECFFVQLFHIFTATNMWQHLFTCTGLHDILRRRAWRMALWYECCGALQQACSIFPKQQFQHIFMIAETALSASPCNHSNYFRSLGACFQQHFKAEKIHIRINISISIFFPQQYWCVYVYCPRRPFAKNPSTKTSCLVRCLRHFQSQIRVYSLCNRFVRFNTKSWS